MADNPNRLKDFNKRLLKFSKPQKGYRCRALNIKFLVVWLILFNPLFGQLIPDTLEIIPSAIALKRLQGIEKELNETFYKLNKSQKDAVNGIVNHQHNIVSKIKNIDSGFALHLIQKWESDFGQLNPSSGPYIARLDTLTGLLKYIAKTHVESKQIETLQNLIGTIKNKISSANGIQNAVTQQQQLIEEWIGNYRIINEGFLKQFKAYQLEVLGYRQKFEKLKTSLNEPAKIERALIDGMHKIPAFNQFLEQNSELATLLGRGRGSSAGLSGSGLPIPGMQSRLSIIQQIQQRFMGDAQNAAGTMPQIIQERIGEAMNSLGEMQQLLDLPDGLVKSGAIGNQNLTPHDKELAAFKSLTAKQKLKIGYNVQSGGGANYFPAINDIGLRASYLLAPRFEAGLTAAYKLGLGDSWQKINLSHEGAAIRAHVDWRIAPAGGKSFKGIWVTGGYEVNYWNGSETQLSANPGSNNAPIDLPERTQTGVVGLSKRIAKGKRELQFQVLWQFAFDHNVGPASPFLFRWGKTF
jgi:hypothetical protein